MLLHYQICIRILGHTKFNMDWNLFFQYYLYIILLIIMFIWMSGIQYWKCKIFQDHFLDNPVFRFKAILKSIDKIFRKLLQKKSFLKVGESAKSLKNTCKEICILESFSVSRNKIFETNLRMNCFFQFFSIALFVNFARYHS